MKLRPALLSFVAVIATALLVGVGGSAYAADTIEVRGDVVVVANNPTIDFNLVPCGTTATRELQVQIRHAGNGNVFQAGSTITISGSPATGVLNASRVSAAITLPGNWNTVPNNTRSPSVDVLVTLTPVAASPVGGQVTLTAVETKANGTAGLTQSITLPVSWSVGSCAPVKTDTATTVTCTSSVVFTGAARTPCTASVQGANLSQSLPVTYSDNIDAGTVTASASYPGDATHNASSNSASFSITRAPSSTTVTCPGSVPYTGSAQTPCTAQTIGVGGLSQAVAVTHTENTNAGTATAIATFAGDANHVGSTGQAGFAISPATAQCSVRGFAGEYDGVAHGAGGVCTGLGGADLSAGLDLGAAFTAVPGGQAAWAFQYQNYASQSGTAQIAIGQAASSISLQCASAVYDGEPHQTCTATVAGVGGLSQELEVTYSDNTNAGTAHASASYPGDGDHKPSEASTPFEITKAPSTTKLVCPASVPYSGSAQTPCTATTTGAGALSANPTPAYTGNLNAGTAHVAASYPGDANHESSSAEGTFVVEKASSSIRLECPTRVVYTGLAHTPCTATVSTVGLPDFPLDASYSDNTDAGDAAASATWTGDDNHVGSTANGGFHIDQASSSLLVKCDSPVVYTGRPLTPCTATVSSPGLDDFTVDVAYENNTDAGDATSSASWDGDANHVGSSGIGGFHIDRAATSVLLECAAVTYTGNPLAACTATASGAGLDDLPVEVTYSNNTDAGIAHAAAGYPGDANHEGSTAARTFTIDKAPSTVTVTCPASVVFTGFALEPCTARVTGPMLDRSVAPLAYADNVAVGPATATATFPGDANHAPNEGSAAFQIAKWSLQGFYKPVDMIVNGNEVQNIVKGGSTVPLKFNAFAGATEITSTTMLKAKFVASTITCASGAMASDDLFLTTGGTSLRYDDTGKQWVQNWQTPKTAGQCYRVTLTTADGSQLTALFKTK